MSSHTPAPWAYAYGAVYAAEMDGEPEVRLALMDRETPKTVPVERDANAAHLVRCVNACAGLNPEAVPLMVSALETALEALDPSVGRGMILEDWAEAAAKPIRAALAKAREVTP